MKKVFFLLLIMSFSFYKTQNLFPVKLENCKTDKFCLDCGDTKGGYDEKEFAKVIEKLNKELNLNGIKGGVKVQVLINEKGKACVLSHTDKSKSVISQKIVEELNSFKKWTAAITKGKKEYKTSVNLSFVVQDGKISGGIERVDINAFEKSFDRPNDPEIFNKNYVYKNENLKNYKITVWNSKNSKLPDNQTDNISIDKNGDLWSTINRGLIRFDGKDFFNAEQNITDKGNYFGYFAVATDNNNIKWFSTTKGIYSYDNVKWKKYEESEIGIDGAYKIINNEKSGEVYFCSSKGLVILKDGKWSKIDQTTLKDLPSNKVYFAKKDSKNRIWIGTFSGSIMIDENGKIKNFNSKNDTPVFERCIDGMTEDKDGNVYVSLFQYGDKQKGEVNKDGGFAVVKKSGEWKKFNTENSGLPFNNISQLIYDNKENILWLSTVRAGLVRYNPKNEEWENYHNKNSEIPTSYISNLDIDKNGNIYLGTRQGIVKIERK